MLIALIIVIMLAIAAYDVPPMIQLEKWRELRSYSILWVAAVVLGILQTAGVTIPNPTILIINVSTLLVEAVASLLGFAITSLPL